MAPGARAQEEVGERRRQKRVEEKRRSLQCMPLVQDEPAGERTCRAPQNTETRPRLKKKKLATITCRPERRASAARRRAPRGKKSSEEWLQWSAGFSRSKSEVHKDKKGVEEKNKKLARSDFCSRSPPPYDLTYRVLRCRFFPFIFPRVVGIIKKEPSIPSYSRFMFPCSSSATRSVLFSYPSGDGEGGILA